MADPTRPTLSDVNEMARTLMDAWEKAEGKPVSVSYVATFVDLARAALTPAPGTAGRWHFVAADDVLLPRPAYDALLAATPVAEARPDGEGVGTGAGEGATGQDTGTAWVTRSTDCPEAPAQAHPLAPEPRPDGDALIRRERQRQIEVEGYTPEHDAEHGGHLLTQAAYAYEREGYSINGSWPTRWPWRPEDWKPRDPISNLIRAGALYLAADEQGYPGADSDVKRCARLIDATRAALAAVDATSASGGRRG